MLELLMTNLPLVICLVAGMTLVILEIFLPGFGVSGISGIALLGISLWITWAHAGPLAALALCVCMVAIVGLVLSLTLRSTARGALTRSSSGLRQQLNCRSGFVSNANLNLFVGMEGRALTPIDPSGMAEFDGVRLQVIAEGEPIPMGNKVCIDRVYGTRILVKAR